MRFSWTMLIRLAGLLSVVAVTVAVELARLEPPTTRFRMATPPAYEVINGFGRTGLWFGIHSRWLPLRVLKLKGASHHYSFPGAGHASCFCWLQEIGSKRRSR